MADNPVKVVFAEDVPKQDFRDIPWQIKVDKGAYGLNNFISAHWCLPTPPADKNAAPKKKGVGHPPHMHKETEIIMLIGMNPNDPYELGATVEFSFGKEMEQSVFTRSCTIIIPGGTPHGYFRITECTKPFMFIQIQEAVNRTEKFLWEYLTAEEKANIEHPEIWVDTGFDD